MSTVTPVDPIEKLFVNTRGQISDQFRLRRLKTRLDTVGDITSMTAEQFTGLLGTDYTRIVGNRLRKHGLDFRPVEVSALYREGFDVLPTAEAGGFLPPLTMGEVLVSKRLLRIRV